MDSFGPKQKRLVHFKMPRSDPLESGLETGGQH